MIFYGYLCYIDKFDRNGMYSTNNKELSISLLKESATNEKT